MAANALEFVAFPGSLRPADMKNYEEVNTMLRAAMFFEETSPKIGDVRRAAFMTAGGGWGGVLVAY